MDENEWNGSRDVRTMLIVAADPNPPPGAVRPLATMTERQLRLFLVGCCRRHWALFEDPACRRAVEVAERFADGNATDAEREEALEAVDAIQQEAIASLIDGSGTRQQIIISSIAGAAGVVCRAYPDMTERVHRFTSMPGFISPFPILTAFRSPPIMADVCSTALVALVTTLREHGGVSSDEELQSGAAKGELELAAQADLLRCVAGSPFREVRFEPGWRSSNVVGLARGIYRDRAFDRLPILSDALLDAGCNEEAIVTHCRDGRPHTRGCWVVDLIFGTK
jgi:hypothetical protein